MAITRPLTTGDAPGRHDPMRRLWAVLRDQYTVRRLRLACGWVMFSYLTLHFLNHALGNISLAAMLWGAQIHEWIWHGPIGGALLYAAFLIHFALALWALYQRRSWRMGWGEGVRLVLGFSIVPLLIHHYLGDRWVYSMYGISRQYDATLVSYFYGRPFWGARQVLVLLVAWTHGCLGMHFWLRHRPVYQRAKPVLLAFAVLLPALALLGVAQGAREAERLVQDPAYRAALNARAHLGDPALMNFLWQVELGIYWAYAALLALVFAARGVRTLNERRRGVIRITYPSGEVVRMPSGLAVLDASRRAGIPHASICGGRGRCSTCRIRILRGFDGLPPPSLHEASVLARFKAGRNVRLACQLRPTRDLAVLPLLPPDIRADDRWRSTEGAADTERFVAIMFIDIRDSTGIVEQRLPYDVVFLLNHFFEAVGGAVVAVGGAPNQFLGDGMMAIFGIECGPREACRQALAAAAPIHLRLGEMNRTLAVELQRPIDIGIGIHAGSVILGELGYRDRFVLTAIGDAVHVAARLQELTKEYGCKVVVSDIVGETAGVTLASLPCDDIRVRGREGIVPIRIVSDVEALGV
ncbi:MAG TPA: adenylate/guanylate cyclase domain-containing protein [Stellaceae bacterium]|nr:adenylate/guanylate cyclase domain-containing protein [Stellaceae bacterium]